MGYYSQFPEAIPLFKVGRVRVTHPCATRHLEQAPMLPFDLHVLSLPLAFILSQDQTIHCIISCEIIPALSSESMSLLFFGSELFSNVYLLLFRKTKDFCVIT